LNLGITLMLFFYFFCFVFCVWFLYHRFPFEVPYPRRICVCGVVYLPLGIAGEGL
jgi:hypothetical protein